MSEPNLGWHVALVDENLHILNAETGFLSLLGISDFYLRHRGILDFLHPDFTRSARGALVALGNGSLGEAAEHVALSRPNGQVFSVELTALALAEPNRIVLAISELKNSTSLPQRARQFQLSRVDAMILEGLVSGLRVAELAQRVCLSRQGVEYHVGAMTRQFDAANRTALVAKAHAAGVFIADVHPPRVDPRFLESDYRIVGS
ncbi:helix-turn-helix transcriptional regulator [Amycolatopsis sp. H20-H5]|uniref:helix-turn-helix transcriptional regulator n=1 Tax=Amycolatopsis sp. H20-H5 TaxID=3046309 RepID=UPI002DBE2683|nr:LuxR C-terminal-related transcriptional regulator [Amycolatopsis sp. H20-H5]MEC3975550.1 LuxR C-terminal-related transcriptional regulator [Amycolatopsis sp. H20-H5]